MSFGDERDAPPAPPDPFGRTLREHLLEAADRLNNDEMHVLVLVARRLAMGRRQYGALDVATDRRSFPREALEEAADGLVYVAAALVKAELAAQLGRPLPALDDRPSHRMVGAERCSPMAPDGKPDGKHGNAGTP